jgi:hypothetical protein
MLRQTKCDAVARARERHDLTRRCGLRSWQGRNGMATMKGTYNIGVADDVKRLRRDLIELKEMVRLGAGIPGDKQRIEMIKGLLARRQKIAPVTVGGETTL